PGGRVSPPGPGGRRAGGTAPASSRPVGGRRAGALDVGRPGGVRKNRMLVLCGGPDITVAGVRQHLSPPTRRQSTLALAYLVLEGRPVPADELADAVWPAGPPKSWASGLRLAISDD